MVSKKVEGKSFMKNMEDQNKNQMGGQHSEGCKCGMCQGNAGGMGGGCCGCKHGCWHRVIRCVLGIVIIFIVFAFGIMIGELKGELNASYRTTRMSSYGSYGRMQPVMQGYYGATTNGAQPQGSGSATLTPAK